MNLPTLRYSAKKTLVPLTGIMLATLGLAACSPTDNPRLAMCQNIANNVVGAISSWDDPKESDNGRQLTIKAAYNSSAGDAGEINCTFKRNGVGNGNQGDYRTSPTVVSINGRKLSQKELVTAGLAATGEQMQGLAEETTKQSKILADQAEQKGQELTQQAEELAGKAGELAKKASTAAMDAAAETSKKVQQAVQE